MGGNGRSGVEWMRKAREEERNGVPFKCLRIRQCIEAHGWKGSRIVWIVGEVGIVEYRNT